jgi:hypothetical protein
MPDIIVTSRGTTRNMLGGRAVRMTEQPKKRGTTMRSQVSNPTGSPPNKLNKEIQVKIGQQLRAIYDEVVQEGVPERFAELLRRLDDRDGEESKS